MSELSPRARAFLARHRKDGVPTDADAARVRAALAASMAAGVATAATPASKAVSAVLVKIGVAAVIVGVVAGVGIGRALRAPAAPPKIARAEVQPPPPVPPPPEVAEAPAPPLALAPSIAPIAPIEPPSPTPARPAPAKVPRKLEPEAPPIVQETPRSEEKGEEVRVDPPPPEPLPVTPPPVAAPPPSPEDEIRLLSEAQDFLRRGDPRAALGVLEHWESGFGGAGQLREEAHAARVVALCASGQLAAGREAAQRYRAEFSSSPQLNRIERACSPR